MEREDKTRGSKTRSSSRSVSKPPEADKCLTSPGVPPSNEYRLNSDITDFSSSSFETYHGTKAALKNLQDSLSCRNGCQTFKQHQGKYQQELFALGVCEHRFCKSCVDNNEESKCPVCSMPYRLTEVKVDKQLSNISALCISLTNILAGKPDQIASDSKESGSSTTEKSNEKAEVTKIKQSCPKLKVTKTKESLSFDENVATGRNRKGSGNPSPSSLKLKDQVTPEISRRGRKRNSNRGECDFHTPNEVIVSAKVSQSSTSTPTNSGKRSGSNQKSQKIAIEDSKILNELKEKENCSAGSSYQNQTTPNHRAEMKDLSKQRKMHSPSPAFKKNAREQKTPTAGRIGNVSILEKRNAKGESPLQVAAVKANFQKVQELLLKGANPNVKDNAGWTPLHEAVNHGNVKIAEILLDHGASVNAPGLENDTPLHDAVSNYSLDCVKLLVSRGANVMARNSHGQTALDMAQTEVMREALLVPDGISVAPEDNTFMETDIFNGGRMCFVTSSLSKEKLISAQECAKLLDAKLLEDHSVEVTHSINGVNADGLCARTLKYLNALLNGAWIVSPEWVGECLKQKKRVNEEDFEVLGCVTRGPCRAPQKARLNRMKKLPGLFDGCQFYFQGKFQYPTPSKDQLVQLVKLGGGIILTREPRLHNLDDYPYTVPYHAASTSSLSDCTIFVIYDDSCPNPPHVKAQRMSYLPASWLMDCIASFALLEKMDYLKH
ncbi:BRCA1-associated RING domain protein 1 [Elysia marginata]|uniref:BRCA1-associated RING domain protein 1 n=1 Tax=Elysia marginata TaxID=1093978 RepID=A0AAV4HMG8_9GAST|nr:BRCA1-associated RING domain protein 1 [Elysia marginata]